MRRRDQRSRALKAQTRAEQGWAQRSPLTQRRATHCREGFPYVRDKLGTIRIDWTGERRGA